MGTSTDRTVERIYCPSCGEATDPETPTCPDCGFDIPRELSELQRSDATGSRSDDAPTSRATSDRGTQTRGLDPVRGIAVGVGATVLFLFAVGLFFETSLFATIGPFVLAIGLFVVSPLAVGLGLKKLA